MSYTMEYEDPTYDKNGQLIEKDLIPVKITEICEDIPWEPWQIVDVDHQ